MAMGPTFFKCFVYLIVVKIYLILYLTVGLHYSMCLPSRNATSTRNTTGFITPTFINLAV